MSSKKQTTSSSSLNLNTINDYSDYQLKIDSLNGLMSEAVLILDQAIKDKDIKIHSIEHRVKEFNSIMNKLDQIPSEKDKFLNDIVGIRIVCLFRSNLDDISKIVSEEFDLISVDDKISNSEDSFGYMSVHHLCRLRQDLKGRRYDTLKNYIFEIQVRTLCMHAWAAISHYLDYKSEWEIPSPLRKDLNALSALFFLADSQYENIFKAKIDSAEQAESAISLVSDVTVTELNYETLLVYLKKEYPSRITKPADVSLLASELNKAQINTIEELDKLLKENEEYFKSQEVRHSKTFHSTGVVRISLCDTHEKYMEVYKAKSKK